MKPSFYPTVWAIFLFILAIINMIAGNDIWAIGNFAMVQVWLAAAWLDGRRLRDA